MNNAESDSRSGVLAALQFTLAGKEDAGEASYEGHAGS